MNQKETEKLLRGYLAGIAALAINCPVQIEYQVEVISKIERHLLQAKQQLKECEDY